MTRANARFYQFELWSAINTLLH